MPHVLVAGKLHPEGLALLEDADGVTFEMVEEVSEASYAPLIHRADGLVIRTQPLTAPTITLAERLKIVSRHGIGYDAVDADALAARGIPLAVVGGVNSVCVAEHALMLMLSATKMLRRADGAVRRGPWGWQNTLEAREIGGKNLLLIGYGQIARMLASFVQPFGMTIRAHDPYLLASGWPEGPVAPVDDLYAGLGWADIVSLHLPRTDRPIIGTAELRAMKPTGVLINTARGGLVDEIALADALASGTIRAAGLDVYEHEPADRDHPLMALDNVILTPHIAGLTAEGGVRLATTSVRNVLDFFAGRLDPRLIVNGVTGK